MGFKLIIIGGPASYEKASWCKAISELLDTCFVNIGEVLRYELVNKTNLGLELEEYCSAGELIGVDLIIKLIRKHAVGIQDCDHLILLGYPRTIEDMSSIYNEFMPSDIVFVDKKWDKSLEKGLNEAILQKRSLVKEENRKLREAVEDRNGEIILIESFIVDEDKIKGLFK